MASSELIISPVGRFISGSMTDTVKTDHLNRPIDPDKYHYSIGIAFRKDDPGTGEMIQKIAAHAYSEFSRDPRTQAVISAYNFAPKSGFSWKIKDGDLPNAAGKTNANAAGCYVIYFSSNFVTKCANQQNAEVSNADPMFTRGNYIQVALNCAGNGLPFDDGAGIYINPQVYRFVGYGEAIVGGVDAATAFGNTPAPQLPPGASATPVASQMAVPAGNASPTPGAPSPTGSPGSVAPHPTFANGPQPGMPAAPSAPAAPTGLPTFPGSN